MMYAIISDIHGNIDALQAVLRNAEQYDVDMYLFLGDLCTNLPYPNEVLNTIRSMKNAVIVKGNEDKRVIALHQQDQSTWTDGQFQSPYWCCRALHEDHFRFLGELAHSVTLTDGSTNIFMSHKSSEFFGNTEYQQFTSAKVAESYQSTGLTRDNLLKDVRQFLNANTELQTIGASLPEGIYLFGHTHVQWHALLGKQIFINPGSCGAALDGIAGAPYTLLCIENDQIQITERRVPYDVNGLIERFRSSSLYQSAYVWSDLMIGQLLSSYEIAMFFLNFAESYSKKIGDPVRPFCPATWEEAYQAWCSQ